MAPSGAILFFELAKLARLLGRWWLAWMVTAALGGCAAGPGSTYGTYSDVLVGALRSSDEVDLPPARFNPGYKYLRVQAQGQPAAYLVLGYVDAHPQGDIEVWYSANREVLKTQNGRIVGTAGLETDWRAVRFTTAPPPWTGPLTPGGEYQRLRDQMPGYRYTITDWLKLAAWRGPPPAIGLPALVQADQVRGWSWFSETTLSSTGEMLPPAWFAWGMHRGLATVVYSEQCLALRYCLKLLRWPVQDNAS